MGTIKQISSELKDWIINTLKSGVSPVSIANAMIKKGFDARFAYDTLFQIVGNNSSQTEESSQQPYFYETPEIGKKGNVINTSDREIKVLSRMVKPFILHLDEFLSSVECDELISISKKRLQPSQVIDPKTGEEITAPGRTSKGSYYKIKENTLIATIEKRIAEITTFPIENGEGLQVLNYKIGEEYKPHFDYFPSNKIDPAKGGQRIGTLLIYLNDVQSGGETIFQKAGLSIIPKKGTAVYFQYGNSRGQVDRMSLHCSVPVLKGEKWVASKWIREGKILSGEK